MEEASRQNSRDRAGDRRVKTVGEEKFTMLAEQGGERVQARTKTLTLEEFLKLPETKPASEYIGGQIQKPMPQGKQATTNKA